MRAMFLSGDSADGQTHSLAALPRDGVSWWHRLPAVLRLPVWPRLLVTLLIIGMLLAFHQVVRGAVQQGELRRLASAAQAQANWRCNTLRGPRAIDNCLRKLAAEADGEFELTAQNLSTGRAIE